MTGHNLIPDRFTFGFRKARETADIKVNPSVQIIRRFTRHQQHFGCDVARFGNQPTTRLCHHLGHIAKPGFDRATQAGWRLQMQTRARSGHIAKPGFDRAHHRRRIGARRLDVFAVERRKPAAQIQQL